MTRLGVIARCDNRGIAYQSYEACRALNPDHVLLVTGVNRKFEEFPSRYDPWDTTETTLLPSSRFGGPSLDFAQVKRFIRACDAIFAVETLYDWEFANWCRARGAGAHTIVQGNPELFTHNVDRGPKALALPHPDRWVWPTKWLIDELPAGPVLPVPCIDRPQTCADPSDPTLRVLHVAGHAAIGDRNGTDVVFEAISHLQGNIHVTVIGQDGAFPDVRKHPPKTVTWECHPLGVKDRWDMYRNQHVVLLPRRYGGNCLPAIEAVSCGLTTIMPDVTPNDMWPGLRFPAQQGSPQRVPYGHVPTAQFTGRDVADAVNALEQDRDKLADLMALSRLHVQRNNWKRWEPEYRRWLT